MGGQVTVALGIGLYFLCLLVIGLFLPTEGAHFCGKTQTELKCATALVQLKSKNLWIIIYAVDCNYTIKLIY